MIPKIIHYCWFGKSSLPKSVENCIASWKKQCPDYEIRQWNESNYNVHKNSFISQAYNLGKYAFVSDFARLDIIYNHGGIYLDTDVELLKPLDNLLENKAFMGVEFVGRVNTGLALGAIKEHPFIKKNRDMYMSLDFNPSLTTTCVDITTSLLEKEGLQKKDIIQYIADITIYPTDFFCPYSIETGLMTITQNTYSIHHYDATWIDSNFRGKVKKRLIPIKIKIRNMVDSTLGDGTYNKIKNILYQAKKLSQKGK